MSTYLYLVFILGIKARLLTFSDLASDFTLAQVVLFDSDLILPSSLRRFVIIAFCSTWTRRQNQMPELNEAPKVSNQSRPNNRPRNSGAVWYFRQAYFNPFFDS